MASRTSRNRRMVSALTTIAVAGALTVQAPALLAAGALAATTIVSTPEDHNGWAADPDGTTPPAYVENPGRTVEAGHTGVGSLDMAVDATHPAISYFRPANPQQVFQGVQLEAVTQAGYAANPGVTASP